MQSPAALLVALTVAASATTLAQDIRPDAIADEPIGWMRTYNFTPPTAPLIVDHRRYSVAQLSISQQIATWIQATFVPTGGLGDVIRSVSEKLNPYNQNTAALPQSYGAYAKIYVDLKYDAARKIVPASNSNVSWSVMANGFFGEPADALSTPERYYFTLPTFVEQGYGPELERAVDLPKDTFLGSFPSWFQRNSSTGNRKFVVMTKNRQLPFVKLTRGEYLAVVEAAVARAYATEKAKIARDNAGNQRSIDYFMSYLETKQTTRVERLAANKAKYRDRLQEPAEIFTFQPDVLLENYVDIFERDGEGGRLRLAVYTIDPAIVERSKTEGPQWILVSWTADLTSAAVRHLHDAVVRRFNAEYVYDYFFDPAQVKGQAYAARP